MRRGRQGSSPADGVNAARLHRLTGAVPRAGRTPSPLPPVQSKMVSVEQDNLSPMAHIQMLAKLSMQKNKATMAEAKKQNEHLRKETRKLQKVMKAAAGSADPRLGIAKAAVDRMREEMSQLAIRRAARERELQLLKDSPLLVGGSGGGGGGEKSKRAAAVGKQAGGGDGGGSGGTRDAAEAGRVLLVLSAKYDNVVMKAAQLGGYASTLELLASRAKDATDASRVSTESMSAALGEAEREAASMRSILAQLKEARDRTQDQRNTAVGGLVMDKMKHADQLKGREQQVAMEKQLTQDQDDREKQRLQTIERLDPRNRRVRKSKKELMVGAIKSENAGSSAARQRVSNSEYEAAFRQIEQATGVGDVDHLIDRHETLLTTKASLAESISRGRERCHRLGLLLKKALVERDGLRGYTGGRSGNPSSPKQEASDGSDTVLASPRTASAVLEALSEAAHAAADKLVEQRDGLQRQAVFIGGLREASLALLVRAVGNGRHEKSGVFQFGKHLWDAEGYPAEPVSDPGGGGGGGGPGAEAKASPGGGFSRAGGPAAVLDAVAAAVLDKAFQLSGRAGVSAVAGLEPAGLEQLWEELQPQVEQMHAEEERLAESDARDTAPHLQPEFLRYNHRIDSQGEAADHAAHFGSVGFRAHDIVHKAHEMSL